MGDADGSDDGETVGPKDGFTLTDGLELGDGVGSLLIEGESEGRKLGL